MNTSTNFKTKTSTYPPNPSSKSKRNSNLPHQASQQSQNHSNSWMNIETPLRSFKTAKPMQRWKKTYLNSWAFCIFANKMMRGKRSSSLLIIICARVRQLLSGVQNTWDWCYRRWQERYRLESIQGKHLMNWLICAWMLPINFRKKDCFLNQ